MISVAGFVLALLALLGIGPADFGMTTPLIILSELSAMLIVRGIFWFTIPSNNRQLKAHSLTGGDQSRRQSLLDNGTPFTASPQYQEYMEEIRDPRTNQTVE